MARDALGSRLTALGGTQTVAALLAHVTVRLSRFDDPAREARELVAALLDEPKHWPLLHENMWLEAKTWSAALRAAEKRAAGAPLAYAVGRANFRALTLAVDERVLIPRPETEQLVDLVLSRCRTGVVADVGTGSGAIALALASEGDFERVYATDISVDALEVAAENARRLGATNVEFVHCDLLASLSFRAERGMTLSSRAERGICSSEPRIPRVARDDMLSAVVSNPPYISFNEIRELPASVRDWEPAPALFSASDGMAATVRLAHQAADRLQDGGLLALETDARRASLVAELLATDSRYSNVSVQLDYAGRERFVLATRLERR